MTKQLKITLSHNTHNRWELLRSSFNGQSHIITDKVVKDNSIVLTIRNYSIPKNKLLAWGKFQLLKIINHYS